MKKRLIDANALKSQITRYHMSLTPRYISKLVDAEIGDVIDIIDEAPTVDAVEISTVDLWLREIAMNSMKMANPMDNQIPLVCAMLIERLDGLREFARERKDDHD